MNTLAKVKPNQLVRVIDSQYWQKTYSTDTISFADNIVTCVSNQQYGGVCLSSAYRFTCVPTHKYFIKLEFNPTTSNTTLRVNTGVSGIAVSSSTNTANIWNTMKTICTSLASSTCFFYVQDTRTSGWNEIQYRNPMLIDLTELYGAGNEPSTVAEFEADFPADYYEYNTTTERKLILSADGKAITL